VRASEELWPSAPGPKSRCLARSAPRLRTCSASSRWSASSVSVASANRPAWRVTAQSSSGSTSSPPTARASERPASATSATRGVRICEKERARRGHPWGSFLGTRLNWALGRGNGMVRCIRLRKRYGCAVGRTGSENRTSGRRGAIATYVTRPQRHLQARRAHTQNRSVGADL